MLVVCEWCGKKFDRNPSEIGKNIFCSKKCFHKALSERPSLNGNHRGGKYVGCVICGKYHYRTPTQLKLTKYYTCSRKCYGKWESQNLVGKKASNYKGRLIKKRCDNCNKEYETRFLLQKFCSIKCKGRFQTKKSTKKIICMNCGKEFIATKSSIKWARIRGSERNFCSVKCRGRYYSGDKNHGWIEDRSKLKNRHKSIRWSTRMAQWRNRVYKRDDWTCKLCGSRSRSKNLITLNCHHIKRFNDYPELRFEVSNGVTLCEDCHRKTMAKEEIYESIFWPHGALPKLLEYDYLNKLYPQSKSV